MPRSRSVSKYERAQDQGTHIKAQIKQHNQNIHGPYPQDPKFQAQSVLKFNGFG